MSESWQTSIFEELQYAYICIYSHLLALFHPHTHTPQAVCRAHFSYLLYFLLLFLAPNGGNVHVAMVSTDKRETSFL